MSKDLEEVSLKFPWQAQDSEGLFLSITLSLLLLLFLLLLLLWGPGVPKGFRGVQKGPDGSKGVQKGPEGSRYPEGSRR